ncbi:unnamed protein product [Lepeophtheirus salmonis]|uniref:(salmon louse) hypothetical protein n=1 Tax=Lepeophtheirus salmonis TaxID=72036 RepID=A0A7R8D9B4_LEPSM|nr:unnamed protein product [Lepeophtheirus salmonis]CAF3043619.1 unnamed protein product [Lepeophtheirus salmonis]
MSHRHLLKDHEVLDYLQLISPSVPEDEKYSCNDESEYIPQANDVEIFQNEPTNVLNELETLLTTVYHCKPSKNVLLFSSLDRTVAIDNGPKRLPETVQYYSSTKYVVDIVDEMAHLYSKKARWTSVA